MHANRLMPNVYRKKLLAFTINPIEQVWRKTRREATHNRYFKNKAELESKLDTYYGKFRAPNQELSSLCSFNYESQKAA